MIEPYDEKHEDAPVERNANLAEPFRGFLNFISKVSIERPATDDGDERREEIG